MDKFEVGYIPRGETEGEFFGVYRAESEEDAIREARNDLSWNYGQPGRVKVAPLALWFATKI